MHCAASRAIDTGGDTGTNGDSSASRQSFVLFPSLPKLQTANCKANNTQFGRCRRRLHEPLLLLSTRTVGFASKKWDWSAVQCVGRGTSPKLVQTRPTSQGQPAESISGLESQASVARLCVACRSSVVATNNNNNNNNPTAEDAAIGKSTPCSGWCCVRVCVSVRVSAALVLVLGSQRLGYWVLATGSVLV